MGRHRAASRTFPFPSLCHARFMADWGSNPSAHYHSSIAAVWIKDMGIIMRMNCQLTSMKHRYLSPPARDLSHFSFLKKVCHEVLLFMLWLQQWKGQYSHRMTCAHRRSPMLFNHMCDSIMYSTFRWMQLWIMLNLYPIILLKRGCLMQNVYWAHWYSSSVGGKCSSKLSSSFTLREGTPVLLDM